MMDETKGLGPEHRGPDGDLRRTDSEVNEVPITEADLSNVSWVVRSSMRRDCQPPQRPWRTRSRCMRQGSLLCRTWILPAHPSTVFCQRERGHDGDHTVWDLPEPWQQRCRPRWWSKPVVKDWMSWGDQPIIVLDEIEL